MQRYLPEKKAEISKKKVEEKKWKNVTKKFRSFIWYIVVSFVVDLCQRVEKKGM